MMARWIIQQGRLCIEASGKVLTPSASEIFCLLNGQDDVVCPNIQSAGDPRQALSDLRFSFLGAPLKCQLYSDEEGRINLRLNASRRGSTVEIALIDGRIIDQCVIDNTWYQVTGNIPAVEEALATAGISAAGVISLKQYVKLAELESFSEASHFDNLVDLSDVKSGRVSTCPVPSSLNASLFAYQKTGFQWLEYMLSESDGCILGDEMGLGKTMQVIAVMLEHKASGKVPILVVAPVSLLMNWKKECSKFAPTLNVCIHHGASRTGNYRSLLKYDVVVTAYSTVVSDVYMLNMIKWSLVALDEAQSIKNPYSARTKSCKLLHREKCVAISGTPFENHVSDIWSILDFIMPGVFGSLQLYQEKIPDDVYGGQLIEPVLTPLMLRRLVSDVAQDLPEKVIITQPIMMSDDEAEAYSSYVEEIKSNSNSDGLNLGMLQKLRQYCTHPYLIEGYSSFSDPCKESVKYQRFCEIAEEIVSKKEKFLVFTSYKTMFDIFRTDIDIRFGIPVSTINGETPVKERQSIVDAFNAYEGPAAMILNPRAAGVGLNITGANHVIHYNFEWNPSLEDQSSARAYRRGQTRTVFIYRLYYVNTVEQVVNERIERKRDTAAAAIVGNTGDSLDRQDIIRALELFPTIASK
jgi:SNF2 family DNA or RNA helicase